MKKSGPDFYDEGKVFETYTQHRARKESPNETMEQPILWDLIGSPKGNAVLDLGCGSAQVARKFKEQGAKNYLGIEGSKKMFALAQGNIEPGFSEVHLSWIETYQPAENSFDLVISSLALHYVADLGAVFAKVYQSLKPGGRLIFSIEHPVITSSNRSLANTALREAWIVDNYFLRGERVVNWMGNTVTKYHRPTEDILRMLKENGFTLNDFREADPDRKNFSEQELWERRRRIPLFLMISASKSK